MRSWDHSGLTAYQLFDELSTREIHPSQGIRALLKRGLFIHAIKYLRLKTGMSLKDAKAYCDVHRDIVRNSCPDGGAFRIRSIDIDWDDV